MPTPPELPEIVPTGRKYTATRRVRLADCSPDGAQRLDAVARWLQDVAADDVEDGDLDEPAWVVRRTYVAVHDVPRLGDRVAVETVCTALASRWAERRTRFTWSAAAVGIDSLTTWVRIDPESGRPCRLTDDFRRLYAESAAGRRAGQSLCLQETVDDGAFSTVFALRRVDSDIAGHLNNAVYWAALWQVLPGELLARSSGSVLHAEVEFRAPTSAAEPAVVVRYQLAGDGAFNAWVEGEDGQLRAVARAWLSDES